jgi:diacylglycerol O-acyltransferase
MKRMAGSDAVFLSAETPTWHQHVGGIVLLEASDSFSYERLVEVVRVRIGALPRFTYQVKETPLGLDRPVWVDAPGFDVENHMIRAACPRPGDLPALCAMAGRIFSQQLDRRRPLWQIWVVEGLEDGGVALIAKWHHALGDGASGMAIAELLFDLEPDPAPSADPVEAEPAGDPPSDLELLGRAFWPPGRTLRGVSRYAGQQLRRATTVVPVLRSDDVVVPMSAPKVSWNGTLGPRRAVALGSVSLTDVKRVKQHFDVKVNDVMIAVIGGAVRRYLTDRAELPDLPLIAGMPFSTRDDGDAEIGNKVSAALVSMATDLEDPVERLRAVHESTIGAKSLQRALRSRDIQSIGEAVPPALITMASRTITSSGLEGAMPANGNVVVSNVPGPPIPLYAGGARVAAIHPMAPIMMGGGLNATLVSYVDEVHVGLLSDADLLPDPWEIVAGLEPSLEELLAAI